MEDAKSGHDQRGPECRGFVVFKTFGRRWRGSGKEDEKEE